MPLKGANADSLQGLGAEKQGAQEARSLPSCNLFPDSCLVLGRKNISLQCIALTLYHDVYGFGNSILGTATKGDSEQESTWAPPLTMAWNPNKKPKTTPRQGGP